MKIESQHTSRRVRRADLPCLPQNRPNTPRQTKSIVQIGSPEELPFGCDQFRGEKSCEMG